MTRPGIASRFVNVEMQVVMNHALTSREKETYLYLKALACGAREVTFAVSEFVNYFGLPRSTMYHHLSRLATSSVLRYGSPGKRFTGLIHVEFLVDPSQPWIDTDPKTMRLHKGISSSMTNTMSPNDETQNPKNGIKCPDENSQSLENETVSSKSGTENLKNGIGKKSEKEVPGKRESIHGCSSHFLGSPNNETCLLTSSSASKNEYNHQCLSEEEEGGAGGKSQHRDKSQQWDKSQNLDSKTQIVASGVETDVPYPFKKTRRNSRNSSSNPDDNRPAICTRILTRVTGWYAYPGSWNLPDAENIIWIYYLNSAGGEEQAAKELKPYWKEWKTRGYMPSNPGWLLDWAATRHIPGKDKRKRATKGVDYGEDGLSPVDRKIKELNAADG